MRIIFLDIDGVLNCLETFKRRRFKWEETGVWDSMLDDEMLKRLKELVGETDAKIVLTSTWRDTLDDNLNPINDLGKNLIDKFNEYGLIIYDKFRKDNSIKGIAEEIKEYIASNYVESFVILDDINFKDLGFENNQITT